LRNRFGTAFPASLEFRLVIGGFMNLSRLTARDLETQARALELQLKKLAHRPRLTPSEQKLTTELKKMRLAMKDRLDQVPRG
jgi:hypothetical protein